MALDLEEIKRQVSTVTKELLEESRMNAGDIFVLGCSSSEICGGRIGKASSAEVGIAVVEAILPLLEKNGIYLAVQGCEHINRALVIERTAAQMHRLEIVSVVPALHAGGACAMAAYQRAQDPVVVEHITAQAGLDIGDTSVGMHVMFVQIPVRPSIKEIGGAHVTCLRSRPKLIGGARAQYTADVPRHA